MPLAQPSAIIAAAAKEKLDLAPATAPAQPTALTSLNTPPGPDAMDVMTTLREQALQRQRLDKTPNAAVSLLPEFPLHTQGNVIQSRWEDRLAIKPFT